MRPTDLADVPTEEMLSTARRNLRIGIDVEDVDADPTPIQLELPIVRRRIPAEDLLAGPRAAYCAPH